MVSSLLSVGVTRAPAASPLSDARRPAATNGVLQGASTTCCRFIVQRCPGCPSPFACLGRIWSVWRAGTATTPRWSQGAFPTNRGGSCSARCPTLSRRWAPPVLLARTGVAQAVGGAGCRPVQRHAAQAVRRRQLRPVRPAGPPVLLDCTGEFVCSIVEPSS